MDHFFREYIAYQKGRDGAFFNPHGYIEYCAYERGKKVREEEEKRNAGDGDLRVIIQFALVNIVNNFFYVYLAYTIATLVYFKTFTEYFSNKDTKYFEVIALVAVTVVLAYYLRCFGYYLRGRMNILKKDGNVKWKKINSFLYIFEAVAPSVILFFICIPFYIEGRPIVSIIMDAGLCVFYFIYLERRFENRPNMEIHMFTEWAYNYDENKKADREPKPLPEGDLYHGNYRFLIMPSIIVAVIIYFIACHT